MTVPSHTRPRWFVRVLVGTGVVALALRVCNLGTFSLWLDEILILDRARGGLPETWAACLGNAEHPPLAALVMSLGSSIGLAETGQRLIPIALGLATVLLIAHWGWQSFGPRVGAIAGLMAALSPLHIRYSQELRPYAYLLFFAVLTLVLVQRLASRPRWPTAALLAVAITGGLYSHLQYPLTLVACAAVLLQQATSREPDERARARRAVGMTAAACAGAFVAYLPWLQAIRTLAGRPATGGVHTWTWHTVGERWEFLTVAARYGDDLSWGGALMAVVALVGVLIAVRHVAGRAALLTIVLGTVGIEVGLATAGHWTHGRYNLIAWPFVVIVISLGVDRLLRTGHPPFLGGVVSVGLVVTHALAVGEYQRIGRPSWDRLASVIELVHRPGEPVLTENEQCEIALSHYLALGDTQGPVVPRSIDGSLPRLRTLWPDDRSCLLVVGRHPAYRAVRRLTEAYPLLTEHFNTARLYRLSTEPRRRLAAPDQREQEAASTTHRWPRPSLALLPDRLRGRHATCVERMWRWVSGPPQRPDTERLELDAGSTAPALLGSWSSFECADRGITFAWATGHEVGVLLHRAAAEPLILRARLRPFEAPDRAQRIRGLLNDHPLGETTLEPGWQTVRVSVPETAVVNGDNLLVLQFAYALAPATVRPGAKDRRPLAAAVDWIEVTEAEAAD